MGGMIIGQDKNLNQRTIRPFVLAQAKNRPRRSQCQGIDPGRLMRNDLDAPGDLCEQHPAEDQT